MSNDGIGRTERAEPTERTRSERGDRALPPGFAPGAARAGASAGQRPKMREAIALSYGPDDHAPRVVAKGQGLIAEEIIRRANAAGVYVHQSGDLVGMLMGLDLDAHIPPRLYLVVAELLAWLRRTEQAQGERAPGQGPK